LTNLSLDSNRISELCPIHEPRRKKPMLQMNVANSENVDICFSEDSSDVWS